MSEPELPSPPTETKPRPTPRPPGAAVPRAPQAPRQLGGDLEPERSTTQIKRRTFAWLGLTAVFATLSGCTVLFFFPRTIREKKTKFKVGFPSDYAFGVDTRYQNQHRIWVVRNAERMFVILAKCTHLGCTPEWKGSENKFKCPCHGSGFTSEGVNFEGPAPRPLERCKVALAPDGQILVDKLVLYKEEDWDESSAFVRA